MPSNVTDTTRRAPAKSLSPKLGKIEGVKPFTIVNRELGAGGVTGVDGIWRDEEDILKIG